MKSLTTFALALLFCVPAMAQFGGMGGMGGMGGALPTQTKSIEVELLEMEQEADKAALKEALLLQARQGMKPEDEGMKGVSDKHVAALHDFIVKKKEAILARDAELKTSRSAGKVKPNTVASGKQPEFDWQSAIERSEDAQVESQLLQAQIGQLQSALSAAIEELAAAEQKAKDNEEERPKADEARKAYEKIKAQFVAYRTKLRLKQQETRGMGGGRNFQ